MAKKRRQQHSKGKHRPRRWHMGVAQGAKNERLMKDVIEPEFAAAEADREEVAVLTREHREKTGDWKACLAQLDRAAPFVPRIEVRL